MSTPEDSETVDLVDNSSEDGTTSKEKMTIKSKTLYTDKMDIDLLTEIQIIKPYIGSYKEVPKKWDVVLKNLKWTTSVKSIRRRFDRLIEQFKSDESTSLKSSGAEESFDDKQKLLTGIYEQMKSKPEVTSKVTHLKEDSSREQALIIRESALHSMTGAAGKRKNATLTEYLEKKQKLEAEHKEKELEFQKEKYEKELEERRKDRELEERKLALQEKQNDMFSTLVMDLLKNSKK